MSLAVNLMTHNGEEFIQKTLESVLPFCQEAIIYDTGSNDRTVDILESMSENYSYLNYTIVDVQSLGELWSNSQKDIALTKLLNEMRENTQSDWILKVDDDEIYPRELMLEIISLTQRELKENECPIFSLPFFHVGTSVKVNYIKRLWRNRPGVIWNGIYGKETLTWGDKRISSKKCPKLETPFYHLGDLRRILVRKHNYESLR